MRKIYRPLLRLLAGATQKELARHVRYLKNENEALRAKLGHVVQVTPQERNRLIRHAAKLGGALDQLCTIRASGHLETLNSRIPRQAQIGPVQGWQAPHRRPDPPADPQIGPGK
jgi:hypothetical protein